VWKRKARERQPVSVSVIFRRSVAEAENVMTHGQRNVGQRKLSLEGLGNI